MDAAPALTIAACLDTGWRAPPDLPLRLVVIAALLALVVWTARRRAFPGKPLFAGMLGAMALWLALSGIERSALAFDCRVSLALLNWPAIMAVVPLWALFLVRYAAGDARGPGHGWLAVLVLPVLVMSAIAISNGVHGALYGAGTTLLPAATGTTARMRFDYGYAFYVAVLWNYVLLIGSFAWVAMAARDAQGALRRHLLGLLAITAVPWLANILYVGAGVRLYGADPTPLSFAAAAIGLALLIRSSGLFEAVPLARRLLFFELPDPVLIVDREQCVVEANAAARHLAGVDRHFDAAPLRDWPRYGAALAQHLIDGGHEPLLPMPGSDRVYDVRVRPIGEGPRRLGSLVQLRDATERLRAKQQLVQALAERNAQLQQVQALQAQLREQALRDPLTGAFNRRALPDRFTQLVRARDHQPLALALIDIDHFKRINDQHGHAAGDAVLQALVAAIGAHLRSSDLLFRVGGEEFVLLMPGADAATASHRLATLRERLVVQPMRAGALTLEVRFSAGVAAWPRDGHTLDELLGEADRALYRAKSAGRDRIELAAPPVA